VTVELEPTTAFAGIRDLPKASSETSKSVRDALLDGPLFKFLGARVDRVTGNSPTTAT
jgi:hypothetical protein